MDWGEKLWDNVLDVEKYICDQNEFFETITVYIRDSAKICNTYQKSINKLNKTTLDSLNKRKKLELPDNSLITLAKTTIIHFDTINKSYRGMYEQLLDLIIDVTRNMNEYNNENRRILSEIDKSRKILHTLKASAENARKSLLTKKLERDTLNKHLDLLDKGEVQKYKKMQSELREKSKLIEKAGVTFEKAKKKLLEFSPNFYQHTLYQGLNTLQDTEISKSDLILSSIKTFLESYSSTVQTVINCINECMDNYISVDVSNDALMFQEHFKNGLPLPKHETIDGDSLDDIGKLDHEMDFKVINSGSHSSLKTNSVRKLTKTETYNNAVRCLETSELALVEATKKKEALDKLVDSSSKFGGFSESLHSQMMTVIAEVEKLEIQVNYYKELVEKYRRTHNPLDEKSSGQYLEFSSDDKQNGDNNGNSTTQNNELKPVVTVEIVKNASVAVRASISKQIAPDVCEEIIAPTDNQPSDIVFHADVTPNIRIMKYDFEGVDTGELSVPKGDKIIVIGEDDGSGWTLVSKVGDSSEGYVPTEYLE